MDINRLTGGGFQLSPKPWASASERPPLYISVTSSDKEHLSSASGVLDPRYFFHSVPCGRLVNQFASRLAKLQDVSGNNLLKGGASSSRKHQRAIPPQLLGYVSLEWGCSRLLGARARGPGWDGARGSTVSSPSQYDNHVLAERRGTQTAPLQPPNAVQSSKGSRVLRYQSSSAEESGGEILYKPPLPSRTHSSQSVRSAFSRTIDNAFN
ncbi:uncharacterized protein EI90DRAFT_3123495 [Cantharellus anzutake]|uniref:uncharacterized protein n=1 Tax=Cantharellus anzutake TaxID=1750568 RepID=UPI001902CA69|nr:uncharacterized protein EI90DRAFT_3123495 [Cantharellus anzutake]KAF8331348.1 hypothetical protein EI90DRAFT_3123495 [Cantharellus anzutake]